MITSATQSSCRWNFIGSIGVQYQFRLTYFDIPDSTSCSDNKLIVYDGIVVGFATILGRLCGNISTFTFQATGTSMSVVLETNTASSSTFKGFQGVIEQAITQPPTQPSTQPPTCTTQPSTQPPTTQPSTQPPTTQPSTQPPTTQPSTQPPTTQPSTQPPTTQPSTQPPTTQPSTQPPTTQPSTQPPTTQPSTQPPTTQPSTQPPTTQPTTQPPTTQPPTTQEEISTVAGGSLTSATGTLQPPNWLQPLWHELETIISVCIMSLCIGFCI